MHKIYFQIAMPLKIAKVAISLLILEALAAFLVFLVCHNVLGIIAVAVIGHPLSVFLTRKEPHFDIIFIEKARKALGLLGINLRGYPKAYTQNTWSKKGNYYEP